MTHSVIEQTVISVRSPSNKYFCVCREDVSWFLVCYQAFIPPLFSEAATLLLFLEAQCFGLISHLLAVWLNEVSNITRVTGLHKAGFEFLTSKTSHHYFASWLVRICIRKTWMKMDASLKHQGWLQAKQAIDTRQHKCIEDATKCDLCFGSTWNEGPVMRGALQTHRGVKQEQLWRSFLSKQTNRERRGGEGRRLLQDRGGSDITLGIMAISSMTCHCPAWCLTHCHVVLDPLLHAAELTALKGVPSLCWKEILGR